MDFPVSPAAARIGNQVPGSEPLAMPSSTERCETRRRTLLASCGAVSIVTSHSVNRESITCNQSLEQAIRHYGIVLSHRNVVRFTRDIRLHYSCLVPQPKRPGLLGRMSRSNRPQIRF